MDISPDQTPSPSRQFNTTSRCDKGSTRNSPPKTTVPMLETKEEHDRRQPLLETKEEHNKREAALVYDASEVRATPPRGSRVVVKVVKAVKVEEKSQAEVQRTRDPRPRPKPRSSLFLPSPPHSDLDMDASPTPASTTTSQYICPPFVPSHSAAGLAASRTVSPSTPPAMSSSLSSSSAFGTAPLLTSAPPTGHLNTPAREEDPVLAFLQQLAHPLPQHCDLFKKLGVNSEDWLDRLLFYWLDFQDALLKEDVTFVECCEIKAGLCRRAQLRPNLAILPGAVVATTSASVQSAGTIVKTEPVG